MAGRARCSGCGVRSARVHSRYVRRLADSAVGHRRVVIELQVRRFRCGEGVWSQTTFGEQVNGLTFRYGRRSADPGGVRDSGGCPLQSPGEVSGKSAGGQHES
ncbi:transposase family protein [Streptomyces sp. NPDC002276]